MLLALLLAAAAAPQLDGAAKKPLIAVLEFSTKLAPEEKADADPSYFSDVVRSQALDELPAARIMTRENMTVLLQAAGKDLADCQGECDVDTGRNLGADDVINGELLKVGSNFKLDLKLHATADGRLLAGAQASGKTVDELDAALPAVVTKLLAPLKTSPAARTPGPGQAEPVAVSTAPRPPAPPAAAPAPAPRQGYRYIRVVDGRVVHLIPFFAPGAREVSRDAQAMLREIAAALQGPPPHPALVVCRGDDASGAQRRAALQRAWVVRHALVELGVSPAALQPRGTDAAGQAQLVPQVSNRYACEIVFR